MAERNIGGLWRKEGANGVFYSGKIDGFGEIVVFANKYATPENRQPNFNIYPSKKPVSQANESFYEMGMDERQQFNEEEKPEMTRAERLRHAEEVGGRDEIKPEDLPFNREGNS